MHHLAVLKGNLLDRIVSGEKTIESRWYKQRRAPWKRIGKGDVVFFKRVGGLVEAKALVDRVLFFSGLDERKVEGILGEYGEGLGVEGRGLSALLGGLEDKKYCILMLLKGVERVEPFKVDKKGYGARTAWITLDNISRLKKA